jgi:hypothetical protein
VFAEAVIKLVDSAELRETMGRKGYAMVLEEREERHIVAQVMEKLYEL